MTSYGLGPAAADDASAGAEPPAERPPTDPVGVVALICGFLGIVVCGIVFSIVTAILGGMTGQRAREQGRSLETAYLVLLLAGVDGIVWIVLHILFDIPLAVG